MGKVMSRPLKILLIMVAVLLVVGLLVPYLVNLDRYRPLIIAEAEKQTGRKLEIGVLRARVLPSVGFTLEKVTLGPPAGFADVNLLTAEAIRGSVALLPLLHGEVEVTTLDIDSPVVVLATDERGKTNYDFSSPPAGKKSGAYKPAAFSAAPPAASPAVTLDSLSFNGATVSMVEVRGRKVLPPSVKVSGLNGDFSHLSLAPDGLARARAKAPLSGVKVELAGAPAVTLRSGTLRIEDGAATGDCEAEIAAVGRVKGEFSVPSLEKLMAPAAGSRGQPVGSGKFSSERLRFAPYELNNLSTDVRIFPDRLEAPLTAAAYGGAINVRAKLETDASPAKLSANIQVTQLDLEKLMAADPATRGKMTGHGELKMQVAGALNSDPVKSLTGEGSFALHDGKLPGVQLDKTMRDLKVFEKIFSLGASGGGGGGETTYSSIEGDLQIRGERLHTNKTHLETNMGTGDVKGSVGFDQSLDLAGTWNLPKGSRAGAATAGAVGATVLTGGILAPALLAAGAETMKVPFTVKGTVKDPKLIPGGGFSGGNGGDSQQASGQEQTQQQKKKKFLGLFPKP